MNESGECSDVEMPLVDDIKNDNSVEANFKNIISNDVQMLQVPMTQSRYENHGGTFTTDIDIFSPEERMKMEERAKRFGLTDKLKNTVPSQEEDLYASMGISEDSENAKFIRLNVIHMRGTEEMSTKDVFKYFEDYAPASIEWINDVSCNVVWLDKMSAARAMLRLSKKLVGLGEKCRVLSEPQGDEDRTQSENDKSTGNGVVDGEENRGAMESEDKEGQENCIDAKDIDCPLPPGIWRKGVDYPKSKGIFLRFASRADKKQPKAEKMSEYYKKYGNPNFGGVKGILTESRKRMYKEISRSRRKVVDEDADRDEGERAKNPWGALSKTWGLQDSQEQSAPARSEPRDRAGSVKERLGTKPLNDRQDQDERSEDSSDSEQEWCMRNKILRMRMHADDEEEKIKKRRSRLRQQMMLDKSRQNADLRSRLGKQNKPAIFRDAIQVVVMNANAKRKDSASEEEDGEIVEEEEQDEKAEEKWKEASEDEGEIVEEEEEEEESEDSAKEIQGPRGSVVKVVQHKPRVASTVWARLKTPIKSEVNDCSFKERQLASRDSRDLRNALKSGDLRSRIGKHTRGRSPLRIEVKNDKYTQETEEAQ